MPAFFMIHRKVMNGLDLIILQTKLNYLLRYLEDNKLPIPDMDKDPAEDGIILDWEANNRVLTAHVSLNGEIAYSFKAPEGASKGREAFNGTLPFPMLHALQTMYLDD